ncbi:MAG: prepilin-type N-terminal cleavage/methylation domain-containing protein [Desulfobacterales bacterium]|nr:MAG: prepilin-type N-terminal cleavage/methylation domain-containing protein [Desulfobacterales bacterium]
MSNKGSTNAMQMNYRSVVAVQTGFTLIELLIAMAILAFGMLAAASMQYSAIRNNTKGNIFTQANMLAKAKLEYLKNLDIHDDELIPRTDPPYSDGSINDNGDPSGIYNRYWTIEQVGAQARRIRMTVEWTRLGETRRVVLISNTRGSGI